MLKRKKLGKLSRKKPSCLNNFYNLKKKNTLKQPKKKMIFFLLKKTKRFFFQLMRGLIFVLGLALVLAQQQCNTLPNDWISKVQIHNQIHNLQRDRELLLSNPRTHIDDMTSEEKMALSHMITSHFTERMRVEHNLFHGPKHSIGGINGPGEGEYLLGFHDGMCKKLCRWIGSSWQFPIFDPTHPVSPEFNLPFEFQQMGPEVIDTDIHIPPIWNTTHNTDAITILNFTHPDDLGRFMGCTLHNLYHAESGCPMMASEVSWISRRFWLWHCGFLSKLFLQWKQSFRGKQWTQKNPTHPLSTQRKLRSIYSGHSLWYNAGDCVQTPDTPWCQQLLEAQRLVDQFRSF